MIYYVNTNHKLYLKIIMLIGIFLHTKKIRYKCVTTERIFSIDKPG